MARKSRFSLCLHALERQAAVAEVKMLVGGAVLPEIELGLGDLKYQRIDFVVVQRIAGAGERGGNAGAQAQNSDPNGTRFALGADGARDAGGFAEIRGRDAPAAGTQKLGAVVDGPVDQDADAVHAAVGRIVADAQHAIEIAGGQDVFLVGAAFEASQIDAEGERHNQQRCAHSQRPGHAVIVIGKHDGDQHAQSGDGDRHFPVVGENPGCDEGDENPPIAPPSETIRKNSVR